MPAFLMFRLRRLVSMSFSSLHSITDLVLDANAPYDDRATDIREVGQVFRVFSMPLPSRALGARSPSRVSSYGTNPLTSRFNTTLIPCQNEIALWDHSPKYVTLAIESYQKHSDMTLQ